jgi:enoyl-CoA hydratase/carnithine racemase
MSVAQMENAGRPDAGGTLNISPVELSMSGPVAQLRIQGAIDLDWTRALQTRATEQRSRNDVRVVRIWAEDRFFCPGGDLRWMAGVSIVLLADVVVAAESATFSLAYAGAGLSPDGGSSWMLPRTVGRRRALEIMLLNPRVDAQRAEQLGLVTRVVPDATLRETAAGLIAELAAGPTAAYGAARRLLMRGERSTFEEQLDAEAAEIARLAGGPTGTEGIHAFLQKRRPIFDHAGVSS